MFFIKIQKKKKYNKNAQQPDDYPYLHLFNKVHLHNHCVLFCFPYKIRTIIIIQALIFFYSDLRYYRKNTCTTNIHRISVEHAQKQHSISNKVIVHLIYYSKNIFLLIQSICRKWYLILASELPSRS